MLWNSPCRAQLPHNGRDVSSLDSTQSQHFRTNKDREFPSTRGWKSKIKAVAGLAYSEAFSGLQMATLLMFLCVAILSLRCTNVSRPLLERTLISLH